MHLLILNIKKWSDLYCGFLTRLTQQKIMYMNKKNVYKVDDGAQFAGKSVWY